MQQSTKQTPHEIYARIYDNKEHTIGRHKMDRDVIGIINRLTRNGYKAYIVGGAIRDLLMSVTPKDYDIVTNATPYQMRRLFANCRIIGKRFRLTHIYFGERKIIEVATFRSGRDVNSYGRIEEDVWRRDFTSNALYYDVQKQYLIDYVGGYKDVHARKLVPLIPPDTIFVEDPARIIRAIKYSAKTNLNITRSLARAIQRDAHLIESISRSRLTEECIKIISSGASLRIFRGLHSYELLRFIQPNLEKLFRQRRYIPRITETLRRLDTVARKEKQLENQMAIYLNLFSFDFHDTTSRQRTEMGKQAIAPITPPNLVIAGAIERIHVTPRNRFI